MWIGVVVGICVGLALWNAAVLSRYGLGGRSRDAHSISAEYRPIVLGLVGFTLLALFVNLTNILAGV
ncbi:MAG TPA: hypothetical protein VLA88_05945 [Candidatus Saccharimonadales bacterium]|nr:hypothetical protein [Candidatus Saccharimonadales bacterium]